MRNRCNRTYLSKLFTKKQDKTIKIKRLNLKINMLIKSLNADMVLNAKHFKITLVASHMMM
jgi:hypothetical protein